MHVGRWGSLSFAALFVLGDVVPRCGGRRHEVAVVPAKAWQPCDPKGRTEFECDAPTHCVSLLDPVDLDGYRARQVCTLACKKDEDCTTMQSSGATFACSASEHACLKATPDAGRP